MKGPREEAPVRRSMLVLLALTLAWVGAVFGQAPGSRTVILSTTTSTQDSGLLDVLVPRFEKQTGYSLKTISVGTGQALALAARGEADVTLAHAPSLEQQYVADGKLQNRRLVMYNDFLLIGPAADPAKVRGEESVVAALRKIAGGQARFVSRGDKSGTHSAELALWKVAGIDIAATKGPWYREIGQGMGAALNTAGAMNGYVLADRGTWISFKNRGELAIAVEGDKRLFNQYGLILVNPAKFTGIKKEFGQAFIDWLVSTDGQAAIAGYKIDGQQLFFPNAEKRGS